SCPRAARRARLRGPRSAPAASASPPPSPASSLGWGGRDPPTAFAPSQIRSRTRAPHRLGRGGGATFGGFGSFSCIVHVFSHVPPVPPSPVTHSPRHSNAVLQAAPSAFGALHFPSMQRSPY